jgi:hypothetical protein
MLFTNAGVPVVKAVRFNNYPKMNLHYIQVLYYTDCASSHEFNGTNQYTTVNIYVCLCLCISHCALLGTSKFNYIHWKYVR